MGEAGIDRLLQVVTRLRGNDGCPWDREQTLETLKPCLIEEAYEVLDALDADNPEQHAEELGDVLLQIVMQARIREEARAFSFDDVAHRISDKLIRRHPHVFGDTRADNSREVLANWERLKADEKADSPDRSMLAGVPRHLPALQKAQRVQGRAARVGFDWEQVSDVVAKVEEELAETRVAMAAGDAANVREELGDLLFAVVNLARFLDINAEDALRQTIDKFIRRFQEVERRVRADGRDLQDCSLAEMDSHWEAIKAER